MIPRARSRELNIALRTTIRSGCTCSSTGARDRPASSAANSRTRVCDEQARRCRVRALTVTVRPRESGSPVCASKGHEAEWVERAFGMWRAEIWEKGSMPEIRQSSIWRVLLHCAIIRSPQRQAPSLRFPLWAFAASVLVCIASGASAAAATLRVPAQNLADSRPANTCAGPRSRL